MPEDILRSVQDYLDKQGYPFEMIVAREFEKKLGVFQSQFYRDPVEKDVMREIDILAMDSRTIDTGAVQIAFVVECKAAPTKWIMFTSQQHTIAAASMRVTQRFGNFHGRALLEKLSMHSQVQSKEIFGLPTRPAYGMVCQKEDKDKKEKDYAYQATMQVVHAARAISEEADQVHRSLPLAFICFPIIAIDAPLVECYLEPTKDKPTINRIKSGVLFSRGHLIHVVTKEALPEFVRALSEDVNWLLTSCDSELREVTQIPLVSGYIPSGGLFDDYPYGDPLMS